MLDCDWRSASTRAVLCPILSRSLTHLPVLVTSGWCLHHDRRPADLVKQRQKLAKAISSLHSAAPKYLRPQTLHGYALPLNETDSGMLQCEFTHIASTSVGLYYPRPAPAENISGYLLLHGYSVTDLKLTRFERMLPQTCADLSAGELQRSLAARILLDSGTFDSTKPDGMLRILCLRRRPQVVLIGSRREITAGSGVL